MKLVYLILTFVALASAESEVWHIIDLKYLDVDLNKLLDKFNPNISKFMVDNGLDPLKLPVSVRSFWMIYPIAPPITYKAVLTLREGTLKNLSNLERYGNATLSYNGQTLKLDVAFRFKSLQGAYDYNLKLLLLRLQGRITALAEDVRAKISITFNTKDYTLSLNKLELQTPGRITVLVHSKSGLWDWIVTPITNVMIPLFKNSITEAIQVQVANAIQAFFKDINRKISRNALVNIFVNQLLYSETE